MDATVATPSLTYRTEASPGVESGSVGEQRPVQSHARGEISPAASSSRQSGPDRSLHQSRDGPVDGRQPGRGGGRREVDSAADGERSSTPPSPGPFDDSRQLESTKRIDPQEAPAGSDRPGHEHTRQGRQSDRGLGNGVSLPDDSRTAAMDADLDRVVDVLYRRLERKLRIERQRKGL